MEKEIATKEKLHLLLVTVFPFVPIPAGLQSPTEKLVSNVNKNGALIIQMVTLQQDNNSTPFVTDS